MHFLTKRCPWPRLSLALLKYGSPLRSAWRGPLWSCVLSLLVTHPLWLDAQWLAPYFSPARLACSTSSAGTTWDLFIFLCKQQKWRVSDKNCASHSTHINFYRVVTGAGKNLVMIHSCRPNQCPAVSGMSSLWCLRMKKTMKYCYNYLGHQSSCIYTEDPCSAAAAWQMENTCNHLNWWNSNNNKNSNNNNNNNRDGWKSFVCIFNLGFSPDLCIQALECSDFAYSVCITLKTQPFVPTHANKTLACQLLPKHFSNLKNHYFALLIFVQTIAAVTG